MLPILKLIEDREMRSCSYIYEKMAAQFELTEEEKFRLNPHGDKYLFSNRLAWAVGVLEEVGYLISLLKDYWKITKQGLIGLKAHVTEDEIQSLRPQYNCDPLYSFHEARHPGLEGIRRVASYESRLRNAFNDINESLIKDILKNIKANTPQFFERLVLKLLVKMGYSGRIDKASVKTTKQTHDEGIDGIINRDPLGLDLIYIQAKRWKKVIGQPELEKFVGALHGQGAVKGIFVTTSTFSSAAKNYVKKLAVNVVLIDGEYLAELMIENNIGVFVRATYEVKAIDVDFFTYE